MREGRIKGPFRGWKEGKGRGGEVCSNLKAMERRGGEGKDAMDREKGEEEEGKKDSRRRVGGREGERIAIFLCFSSPFFSLPSPAKCAISPSLSLPLYFSSYQLVREFCLVLPPALPTFFPFLFSQPTQLLSDARKKKKNSVLPSKLPLPGMRLMLLLPSTLTNFHLSFSSFPLPLPSLSSPSLPSPSAKRFIRSHLPLLSGCPLHEYHESNASVLPCVVAAPPPPFSHTHF